MSQSNFRYLPDWESLKQYAPPDWYVDGKFGIFIHWGVYSVPAFGNEWYPRNMYRPGTDEFKHHAATYGPQASFGYKDFIPRFKAERFDAGAWAELFRQAGAAFVVPVAEHHDGFAMYDCGTSRWTAARMGPRRDIIGELADATRRRGMVFGLSSHRAEHWWFMNGGRQFDSDVQDPACQDFYGPAVVTEGEPGKLDSRPYPTAEYLDDWLARTCELVDKYQPQLVWFDWWIGHEAFKPYLPRFASYYYNRGLEWGKGVAINYKEQAFPAGTAVYDIERGGLAGIHPYFWQTDTAVSKNSWGYVANQDYKRSADLIGDLVDIVSKNGALLLNIGPKPDGTIPEPEQAILRDIGAWLAAYGEAVYGTRPWVACGEGPTEVVGGGFNDTKRASYTPRDFRFTAKGDAVYAVCLAAPEGEVKVASLGAASGLCPRRIEKVELLGEAAPVAWSREPDGLSIRLGDRRPDGACAFKATLAR